MTLELSGEERDAQLNLRAEERRFSFRTMHNCGVLPFNGVAQTQLGHCLEERVSEREERRSAFLFQGIIEKLMGSV